MSHYVAATSRAYVECDEPERGADGAPVPGGRCGRRSYGSRDRFGEGELSIFDLPRGWSVAPFPDEYDHGATRTSLLDGAKIPPIPQLVGIFGDLHTCPRHRLARSS